jgi:hypothetical protein
MSYPLYVGASLSNSSQQVGMAKLLLYDVANGGFGSLVIADSAVEFRDSAGTIISFGAGSGDMVLASVQTVTGAKTFRNATLLLRNVANTFSSQFVNTNTDSRTYTLPDASGTVALTSNITGTNSGTNTGDQTITLTGAVTGSGTGTFAASLGTFTKAQLDTAVSDGNVLYVGDAISSITVREIDGSPSIAATTLEFSNGHVTDMGGGVARISITGGGGGGGSTPTDITVANEASDTTCFVAFFTAATGDLGPKTNASLTYNSATSSLACTTFVGALTGNASTVTTNANLTGPITSVGNATSIASDVALAGNPTTTTQSATDNSTRLATTAHVKATTSRLAPFKIDTTTTGAKKLYYPVPFACTITGWELVADTTGSVVIDIWSDSFANYPPAVGDSITGSAKPTISSANKASSTTLTGWTTTLPAGHYLEVNVDSATTITNVTLTLIVTRT